VKRRSRTPDSDRRLLSSLGLAARAGQLRIGYDAVSQSIRSGQAVAVVVARDAPDSVLKRLEGLLASHSVPHRTVLDGDRLGAAVGRDRVVALAITDSSLGQRAMDLAEEVEG
jgi:ribosomal protein L7Ae-like RNA K-turn-binding protein